MIYEVNIIVPSSIKLTETQIDSLERTVRNRFIHFEKKLFEENVTINVLVRNENVVDITFDNLSDEFKSLLNLLIQDGSRPN